MPLLKSPQPETEKAKTEEQGELSAAEDFSDIGESDEEILNQDNDEEMPEAETEEANNEHETVIFECNSKHSGYLRTNYLNTMYIFRLRACGQASEESQVSSSLQVVRHIHTLIGQNLWGVGPTPHRFWQIPLGWRYL